MAKEFSVGQIWEYKTRATELGSKVTILKIDFLNDQEIIHIYVGGLKLKNPQSPTGYGEDISHMPISPDALKESVTELVNQTESLPNFEEGYEIWREAFDSGKAGIFTISVKECVEFMEQTINQ